MCIRTESSLACGWNGYLTALIRKDVFHPEQCGLVDWVLSCKPKGRRFDSWLGHMPGLRVQSWLGHIRKATDRCFSLASMFFSLSFSLPPPLSKIKVNFLKKLKKDILPSPLCLFCCCFCVVLLAPHLPAR